MPETTSTPFQPVADELVQAQADLAAAIKTAGQLGKQNSDGTAIVKTKDFRKMIADLTMRLQATASMTRSINYQRQGG